MNLSDTIIETIAKIAIFERQVLDLGEKMRGALSQASFSVLGTDDTDEQVHIIEGLVPQDFKDGAVLIKEGEPRDALFIIVEGQVSCTQRRRHRCEVGAARAALLERLSALAPLGLPAPRCSARQGCASQREAQSARGLRVCLSCCRAHALHSGKAAAGVGRRFIATNSQLRYRAGLRVLMARGAAPPPFAPSCAAALTLRASVWQRRAQDAARHVPRLCRQ